MKALAFIRVFKRFTARRGTPDVIVDSILLQILRTQWRIGKINKLVIGKDFQVRDAELPFISEIGEKQYANLPICQILLILFDITIDNCELSNNKPVNDSKRAEDRLEWPRKRDKTYDSYKTDIIDSSSTWGEC